MHAESCPPCAQFQDGLNTFPAVLVLTLLFVGSSTQVGVLVVPFCVVLAWAMGRPLDLNFNEFEALVLFVSVLLATLMVQDGTSNWLKGALLVLTYVFVSAGFWVHKDASLMLDAEGMKGGGGP